MPMNMREDVWGADSALFRPERFRDVGELKQGQPLGVPGEGGHRFGFVPFGAGRRSGNSGARWSRGAACFVCLFRPQVLKPLRVARPPLLRCAPAAVRAGQRTCVGQRLAMLEAVQILASLALHFDFALLPDRPPVEECADVTLGPKQGLPILVSRRGARGTGVGAGEPRNAPPVGAATSSRL